MTIAGRMLYLLLLGPILIVMAAVLFGVIFLGKLFWIFDGGKFHRERIPDAAPSVHTEAFLRSKGLLV